MICLLSGKRTKICEVSDPTRKFGLVVHLKKSQGLTENAADVIAPTKSISSNGKIRLKENSDIRSTMEGKKLEACKIRIAKWPWLE